MKKLSYLIPAILLCACATPKYTASTQPKDAVIFEGLGNYSPSENKAGETELTASIKATPILAEEAKNEIRKTYINMTKSERRELRQLLKKEVKNIVKLNKKEMTTTSVQKSSSLDHDLKLAAIFGAVGIVFLLISSAGNAFNILGAIALIIGAVFFVKWLIRQ